MRFISKNKYQDNSNKSREGNKSKLNIDSN